MYRDQCSRRPLSRTSLAPSSKTTASSRTRWASSSMIWAGVTSLKGQDLVPCRTTKELGRALRDDGLRF